MSDWDRIGSYSEIVEEARKARDVGESLSSVTHVLCALGLDLGELSNRIAAADAGCEGCDALAAELEAATESLRRATHLAENLHGMIDRQTWRDSGGDDGQGHYEGDLRAEQIHAEIKALAAGVPADTEEDA